MKEYKEHKFKNFEDAKSKQVEIKKRIGYCPSIYREKKLNKKKFVLIEPKGLKKQKFIDFGKEINYGKEVSIGKKVDFGKPIDLGKELDFEI